MLKFSKVESDYWVEWAGNEAIGWKAGNLGIEKNKDVKLVAFSPKSNFWVNW